MREAARSASAVVKRSLLIAGHATSISLEQDFWDGLKAIASERGLPIAELVATIDAKHRSGNLSSTIRVFVLNHYRGEQVGTDQDLSEPAA